MVALFYLGLDGVRVGSPRHGVVKSFVRNTGEFGVLFNFVIWFLDHGFEMESRALSESR